MNVSSRTWIKHGLVAWERVDCLRIHDHRHLSLHRPGAIGDGFGTVAGSDVSDYAKHALGTLGRRRRGALHHWEWHFREDLEVHNLIR
jgi:hypothetical protein